MQNEEQELDLALLRLKHAVEVILEKKAKTDHQKKEVEKAANLVLNKLDKLIEKTEEE